MNKSVKKNQYQSGAKKAGMFALIALGLSLSGCGHALNTSKCEANFAALAPNEAKLIKNSTTRNEAEAIFGKPRDYFDHYPSTVSIESAEDYYITEDGPDSGLCGQLTLIYNNDVLISFNENKLY